MGFTRPSRPRGFIEGLSQPSIFFAATPPRGLICTPTRRICIRGLGAIGSLCVPYKGEIRVKGKQGRMEILYDHIDRKWHAHISFEVTEKRIKSSWFKIPLKPKGDLSAGIDIGINTLYAVYVENGRAMLINGRPLKTIAYCWRHKISMYQSILNKSGYKTSRRLARMYRKVV